MLSGNFFEAIPQFFGMIWNIIMAFFQVIGDTLAQLWTTVTNTFSSLNDAISFSVSMFDYLPNFVAQYVAAALSLAVLAVVIKIIPWIG